MNTDARSVACYVDTTRAWMAGRLAARIPGSPEDGHDTLQRFDEAVGRICEQAAGAGDSAALLVSHGTALPLWTSLRAAAGGGADPVGRGPPPAQHRHHRRRRRPRWRAGASSLERRRVGPGPLLNRPAPTAPRRGRPGCGLGRGWPGPRRITGLADDTAVHEDQLIAHLAGEAHLVGDHDHRHPVGGEVLHDRSTSPTNSGSSAEVGSSKSMSQGPWPERGRSPPAAPDPPRAAEGSARARSPSPTRSSSSRPRSRARPPGAGGHPDRGLDDVRRAVMWGKRLKRWKTMPIVAR